MSSSAAAHFTVKNLKGALPPGDTDVAIATTLKKQYDDTTLSFSFTDLTLKDPKRGQGIVVGVERRFTGGVKAAVNYDVHKQTAAGTLTLNKSFDNGSDLELKGIYRQAGDVFILEETWKLDSNNKITGHYNFNTEEAIFGYTYTKDSWSATGKYNFQKDTTLLEVEKKQGKSKYIAAYHPKDGSASLTWNAKPFKATIKGNVGRDGAEAQTAIFSVTHEFDL